jgi:hypothetical protein
MSNNKRGSAIKQFILSVLFFIVPFLQSWKANRAIEKKCKGLEDGACQIDMPQEIKASSIIKGYEYSFRVKDKLEDKAKSIIVPVIISIALIMRAPNAISGAVNNLAFPQAANILIILFISAVLYMMISGISALRALAAKNKIYIVLKADGDLDDEDLKEYYESAALNNLSNTVRNNLIFTSFACIRNALICLFAALSLTLVPLLRF